MLEHFKETRLFILIKNVPDLKKIANINVIVIFFTYYGSTKCSQPVWGHESCRQCYFHLCFLTRCLFLSMIDMYRSLALLCT